ncbi:asparagine synthase-related protein [Cytobacillus oceanisediminis]|uniref:asparagine synthase (glutamine-hydrolyzing) n=1 Tax=Cytobacillus oceanisediminis 2691 TaxID=1196031 RepID=A0A160MFF0_9BACI|nr:asparagine synthase-related protein [Cytobacillus oceanisediminis]AND41946.1 asparagine synthetase B [Cytobacillus oceanisediminis 2691]
MSAIAGIYNLNGEPVSIEQSSGMMKAFEKFPVDDIQTWQKESIFLGCHAQWITPESIGEQLPFYDYQRQLAITADAIIDNREELFERLQIDREDRKKITDSQLILLAYHKWGEESPKFLVGDFAFMIWDEKERKMFGARDFSGARTLYYFRDNQRFGFGTTIQPLFSLPGVKKELNEMWLAEFLANPGMFDSVDPFSSVYKGIAQIPPSHSLLIKGDLILLHRYCTLPEESRKLQLKSDEEYEEAFKEVFKEAVNNRLRTFREVGAHLSGGLDSGSVVSFAAKPLLRQKKQLHTFSYVPVDDFVDWTHKSRIANEKPLIESTIKHVGNISANFHSFSDRNPYLEIDYWLENLEMPYKFFENTFWLRGIYEEAQNKGIGVLLNGQRGNWTISWGPILDYYALLLKKVKWLQLYRELNLYSKNLGGVRKQRILSAVNKKVMPLLYKLQQSKESPFPLFINKEFSRKTRVFEKLAEYDVDITGLKIPSAYAVRKKQFNNLYYWNTTGTYGTKLSLNSGVIERDPTNDLRVIRYCLAVPEEQYVKNGLDRALIRRATKEHLPEDIRLNLKIRGVQGADGVHRMRDKWDHFICEADHLKQDPIVKEYLDNSIIEKCISLIKKNGPKPELAFEFEFKVLMRSMIFYRFIKTMN